jgi:putative transposase
MGQSRFGEEQMGKAIKQLDAGRKAEEVGRKLGVSKETPFTQCAKYGGLEWDDLKRVKGLKEGDRRLKSLGADLSLDREELKWIIERCEVRSLVRIRNIHGRTGSEDQGTTSLRAAGNRATQLPLQSPKAVDQ